MNSVPKLVVAGVDDDAIDFWQSTNTDDEFTHHEEGNQKECGMKKAPVSMYKTWRHDHVAR